MTPNEKNQLMENLLAFALETGFSQAAGIAPAEIQVENHLAANCREPRCPNYGMSASCPPHVGGPASMRRYIDTSSHALVLRLEVDSASLLGEERPQAFRLLHELTATVENEGRRLGFSFALGFAGGSCKNCFCHDEKDCAQISSDTCRHPSMARQSMSGFGVNVGALMKTAGFTARLFSSEDQGSENLTWIAALILLGDGAPDAMA